MSHHSSTVTFRACGSTYCPVTMLAVSSSSHRCPSTFRAKCRACSRPAASRYRARHLPLGRLARLATVAPDDVRVTEAAVPGALPLVQVLDRGIGVGVPADQRSEEHTSELQSRENLVCRLLLEKKNKKICT